LTADGTNSKPWDWTWSRKGEKRTRRSEEERIRRKSCRK